MLKKAGGELVFKVVVVVEEVFLQTAAIEREREREWIV